MAKRKSTEYIVIHCTATPPEMDIGVKEVDRWHKERGWAGCGYHAIIRRNGQIELGRAFNQVGAHAKGYNSKAVGIALAGGVNGDNKPSINFLPDQMDSLIDLISFLIKVYPDARVIGHNEISDKACPSFDVTPLRALFTDE